MRTHQLKILPPFFNAVLSGEKTFEIRLNDRDFHSGDLVFLKEYSKKDEEFTGRVMRAEIGFVFKGSDYGVKEGYCVFALLKTQFDGNEIEYKEAIGNC